MILLAGYGYVGRAIHETFKDVADIHVVDPKHNNNEMSDFNPEKVIIAVSTPEGKNGECDMTNVFDVLKNMSPEKALGRMVVDVHSAVTRCDESSDIVLEDGDRIVVPKYQDEVSVIGQVYFPTSHKYRNDRAALDYIGLSGGVKELAQYEHAYIVQANGEVMSVRSSTSSWGLFKSPANVKVTPGSTIFVPLSVSTVQSYINVSRMIN